MIFQHDQTAVIWFGNANKQNLMSRSPIFLNDQPNVILGGILNNRCLYGSLSPSASFLALLWSSLDSMLRTQRCVSSENQQKINMTVKGVISAGLGCYTRWQRSSTCSRGEQCKHVATTSRENGVYVVKGIG